MAVLERVLSGEKQMEALLIIERARIDRRRFRRGVRTSYLTEE